jgi:hypothetical protein
MRSRTVVAMVSVAGMAIVSAGTALAVGGEQGSATQSGTHYVVRCLHGSLLQDSLNTRFRQGWKLVEMAPSECRRVVAGTESIYAGFTVVLER